MYPAGYWIASVPRFDFEAWSFLWHLNRLVGQCNNLGKHECVVNERQIAQINEILRTSGSCKECLGGDCGWIEGMGYENRDADGGLCK